MIRILLADDHAMVRTGLRLILDNQSGMCVIAEAQDGMEAVALALQLEPTVAILDIGLPHVDGLDALERIKARAPHIRVLMLTGQQNEQYVRRALQGGASGYLLKQNGARELVQAVRTVAHGDLSFESLNLAGSGVLDACNDGSPSYRRLTERERDVLRLVAQGYSNGEIATQLRLSPKTVDTHRTRVMDKLDLHSRAALTTYALHQGYLIVA